MKLKIAWHHKRCAARTRLDGHPCRNWAMPNGRCRMHGGKSTGPRPENRGKSGFKHGASIPRILNDKERAYFKSIRRRFRKDYPNLSHAGEKTLDDLCLYIVRMNRLLSYEGDMGLSTFSALESKIRKHFRALNTGVYPVPKPPKKPPRPDTDKLTEFVERFLADCLLRE
ncbi:MAG: HGGxSTG domain-containing protein [bacterium]